MSQDPILDDVHDPKQDVVEVAGGQPIEGSDASLGADTQDVTVSDDVQSDGRDKASGKAGAFSVDLKADRSFPLDLLGHDLAPEALQAEAHRNGWFDADFYLQTYSVETTENPFVHFCRVGAFFGACPNARAQADIRRHADMLQAAHEAAAPDESAAHPFDPAWYSHLYLAVRGITIDPWEHYAALGHRRGYHRNAAEHEGLRPSRAFVRGAQAPAFSLRSLNKAPSGVGHLAGSPDGSHVEGSRAALLDAKNLGPFVESLATSLDERLDAEGGNDWVFLKDQASAYFNRAIAKVSYKEVLGSSATFAAYLETGYALGLYPNLATAIYDECVLRQAGQLSTSSPRYGIRGGRSRKADDNRQAFLERPLKAAKASQQDERTHFAELARRVSNNLFDAQAYAASDRTTSGHLTSVDALRALQDDLLSGSIFDPEFYASDYDATLTREQLSALYLLAGQTLGHEVSPIFDRLFYTETYPDILRSRILPEVHYERHGREEKRLSLGESPVQRIKGGKRKYKARPTILVFSHEASFSGAPIVALNIAKGFSKTHNVVAWIGKSGPLDDAFAETCTDVRIGWSSRARFAEEVEALRESYDLRAALVNSIVSHPVLSRIKAAGLPAIGVIHEFANYVYPSGTTSRGAMLAEASVYPARIVSDALKQELARHETPVPDTVLVRHQGYNSTSGKAATQSAQDILARIGATDQSVVVLGAGHVEARKGVDLFLQTAQRCRTLAPETDWKFIWVGGGFDPLTDLNFSLYLDMQIRLNGLDDVVTLFGHQPTLAPFWDVADIFFLSSRLDPFPNVVLDALNAKVPVVCFDDATGFEDIIESHPYAVRSVPFLDCHGAAQSILDVASHRDDIAKAYRDKALDKDLTARLSFESYVAHLDGVVEDVAPAHRRFEKIRDVLSRSSLRRLRSLSRRLPAFVFPAWDGYDREELTVRLAAFFSSYETIPYRVEVNLPEITEPASLVGASDEFDDAVMRAEKTNIVVHANTAEQIDQFAAFFNLSRHALHASVAEAGTSAAVKELTVHTDMMSALPKHLSSLRSAHVLVADISDWQGTPSLTEPVTTTMLGLLSGRYADLASRRYPPKAVIPIDLSTYNRDSLPVLNDKVIGYFDRKALYDAVKANAGIVSAGQSQGQDDARIEAIYETLRDGRKTAVAGAVAAWID